MNPDIDGGGLLIVVGGLLLVGMCASPSDEAAMPQKAPETDEPDLQAEYLYDVDIRDRSRMPMSFGAVVVEHLDPKSLSPQGIRHIHISSQAGDCSMTTEQLEAAVNELCRANHRPPLQRAEPGPGNEPETAAVAPVPGDPPNEENDGRNQD